MIIACSSGQLTFAEVLACKKGTRQCVSYTCTRLYKVCFVARIAEFSMVSNDNDHTYDQCPSRA